MIGGGFLGGGISIVPAGKAIIYASMTTEDGANIPNAVFKATQAGSTVTANGGVDGRAELLVDAGHTYTVTVTPAGGSYLNRSQTVATASAKSYAVEFYLYPAKANEASTTASLNALNTSISTHAGNTSNPHAVTKAQVGLSNVDNTSDVNKPISTATQTALNAKQAMLTFDNAPTTGSINPVTSGGVKTALDAKQDAITGGATTIATNDLLKNKALVSNISGKVVVSPVSSTELGYLSGVTSPIQTQLNGKQATLAFDNVPLAGSTNPVTSGGVYTALDTKQDKFSLYEHTIRVWTTNAPDKFRFSLTVLNQSSTGFTLPTLHSYLGGSAGDYKQCSGMVLTALSELTDLTGVRGGAPAQFFFEGVNGTGAIVNAVLDWTQVEILHTDKVRQIV